jgi:hypothetical protein
VRAIAGRGAVSTPKYDVSAVRTLAAAMGTPADVHDYAITDTETGQVRGIYRTQELALAACVRLMRPGALLVLTVVHPPRCGCPEVARL